MAIVDLVMPKLGESIMEATILKWYKKPGDTVKQDETLLDIATDKVDSEVPSTAEGVITELMFKENDVVPIGNVIARIETNNGQTAGPKAAEPAKKEEPEAFEPEYIEVPYVPQPTATIPPPSSNGIRFYSPLVLNIAGSEGLSMAELEKIPGTGNDGRVTKKDILQYVLDKKLGIQEEVSNLQSPVSISQQPVTGSQLPVAGKPVEEETKPVEQQEIKQRIEKTEPVNAKLETGNQKLETAVSQPETANREPETDLGNVEIIEMDRMRKLIAKHMVYSKQVSPHVTSFSEADVTNMVLWREKVKQQFEKTEGTKITFTPMFIDCLARVMKRFPMINSSVDGERIIIKKDINIGMATAMPSGNLIVPVIHNADYLNLVGLSKKVNTLAENARTNKLRPNDTQGGTFTLTNVGTFGSLMGTPIINQPQAAILALGAIKKRPMVIETENGDTIAIRHMMYLSLSYDHRIIDGSLGASFLTAVAKEFENWNVDRVW
jgi:2-oxoglutarate dehydrogenase E2 component (dihydrolipoamide succinyltransferase)